MKLAEIMLRDAVTEPGGNTPQSHYRSGIYEIALDQGLVTLTLVKTGASRIVPLTNVKFMTPLPPVKLAKGA